jgi:hypothetical protein
MPGSMLSPIMSARPTTQGKKPLVSFAYKTEAEAKQAAAKVWPVIANAISVTPHVIVR